jgi:CTP:molybdopterin cytidylyltransferase MocA
VRGEPGVPLILPRWLYARTGGLKGDQGLREVVRRLPKDSVSLVVLPSAELDVDTPRDLEGARRRVRSRF